LFPTPLIRVLARLTIKEGNPGASELKLSANLVVAVPGDSTVTQLLSKVEQEYALQQHRLTREHPVRLKCQSIYIKEVFEVCDHRSLVADVLTDYIEVTIFAERTTSPT